MSVFNSSRLAGKTVLITGASVGIGAVSISSHFGAPLIRYRVLALKLLSPRTQATAILFARVRTRAYTHSIVETYVLLSGFT